MRKVSDQEAQAKQDSRCKTCGEPLIWLKHVRTKSPAPIDREPTPIGNILIDIPSGTWRNITRDTVVPPGTLRYTDHWSTCKDDAEWKRLRGS